MMLPYSTDLKKSVILLSLTTLLLLPVAAFLAQPGVNEYWFLLVNNADHGLWAHVWIWLTNLGDGFFLYPVAMLLFIVTPDKYWSLILTMIVGALLLNGGKAIITSARPLAELHDAVRVLGPALRSDSMPSGHTGTVFLLAGLVLFNGRWWLAAPLVLCSVLVAVSRVVVGAHWPQDLVVGAWLGIFAAVIGSLLGQKINLPKTGRALFIALGFLCVLVLPFYDNGYRDQLSVLITQFLLALLALTLILWEIIRPLSDNVRLNKARCWLKTTSRRFMKFGLVGGSGFLVDLGSYTLMTLTGTPHLVARAISYWISASWNWFWNRNFTFAHVPKQKKLEQWLKYLLMCLFSFVLNWGTYYLLTTQVEFFAQYKQLGLIAGVAVGMFFNFTIASSVIFTVDNFKKGREV